MKTLEKGADSTVSVLGQSGYWQYCTGGPSGAYGLQITLGETQKRGIQPVPSCFAWHEGISFTVLAPI
jgi:hypothetical protein